MAEIVESKIKNFAEILPDNDRTAVIMKKRQEEEAAAKEKFDQMMKMKE